MPARPPAAPLSLRLLLAALLTAAPGCAQWPRSSHLPAGGDPDALPAGADPRAGVQVDWRGPLLHLEEGEADAVPTGSALSLALGGGYTVEGSLAGSGWSEATSSATGTCGELAFPIEGTYLADLDWLQLQPEAGGTLCVELELEGPDAHDLLFDLVPLLLDACGDPTAVLDEGEGPLGYGLQGPTAGWSAEVRAHQVVGVALAAYWPQDPELDVGWRFAASLVDGEVCPLPPESP